LLFSGPDATDIYRKDLTVWKSADAGKTWSRKYVVDAESGAAGRGGERARDAFLDELAPAVRATSALWAGLAGTPPL
jgi:hypothetical protein